MYEIKENYQMLYFNEKGLIRTALFIIFDILVIVNACTKLR